MRTISWERCGQVFTLWSADMPSDNNMFLQVPYPLISLVTRLPQTLNGKCPLTIRTRTFEYISLAFDKEPDAVDVFDSVKELTVASAYIFRSLYNTIDKSPLSFRRTTLRILLCSQSTFASRNWLVNLLPSRRIWAHGRRLSIESMEVHGHQ